ncbi:hypothetical protein F183_A20560 [Bryobacterales bacterium F-183]|nr:hypothetical protein F183_A20560 [Bryobacterales bacterium F-183]
MRATFVLIILMALANAATGQAPVSGTLTVNGKSYPVTSACLYEEPAPFNNKEMRLSAMFWTDGQPLARKCRDSSFDLSKRLREGGTPYVIARLDLPKLEWSSGVIGAGNMPMSFSYSGSDPAVRFEGSYKDGSLTGHFVSNRPLQMGDSPALEMNVKVTDLKAEREEPITSELTGAAAAKSPAALAAAKVLSVMSKGDPKAIRALIVEDERKNFDADLASSQGKEMIGFMTEMAKSTIGFTVTSVVTRGPVTIVKMEKKTANGKESSTFKFRQENGEYRITQNN